MYRIGDFSKITRLSVKTLRYYDEIHILSPSMRDEQNHYRYYSEDDFHRAEMIKLLRSLDFSIQEIQDVITTIQAPGDLSYYLEEKQNAIRQEIRKKEAMLKQINTLLSQKKENQTVNQYQIERVKLPKVTVAAFAFCGAYKDMSKHIAMMYKEIKGNCSKDAPLNCYYDQSYKENAHIEICIPIKKQFPTKNCTIKTLEAIKGISLTHYGSYDMLNMAYKVLIDYANAQHLSLCVPSREIYIKGPGKFFMGNPHTYVTKIVIPYQEEIENE